MTLGPPHRMVDDSELMRRHVDGDSEAFGELVRRHQDRMWAVALRTLGNRDDAADSLQDAFVNAFRRASSYRGDSAVTTWLHRIVVNACLDRIRHAAARPADPTSFDDDMARDSGQAVVQPVSSADPAGQAALRVDLTAALSTLPDEQRVPLVLVDVEGYSVADVASMLDLPVGTVKSRCARARARLLPLLQPGWLHDGSGDTSAGNRADDRNVTSESRTEHTGKGPGGGDLGDGANARA